jgi:hypothetical protein
MYNIQHYIEFACFSLKCAAVEQKVNDKQTEKFYMRKKKFGSWG